MQLPRKLKNVHNNVSYVWWAQNCFHWRQWEIFAPELEIGAGSGLIYLTYTHVPSSSAWKLPVNSKVEYSSIKETYSLKPRSAFSFQNCSTSSFQSCWQHNGAYPSFNKGLSSLAFLFQWKFIWWATVKCVCLECVLKYETMSSMYG